MKLHRDVLDIKSYSWNKVRSALNEYLSPSKLVYRKGELLFMSAVQGLMPVSVNTIKVNKCRKVNIGILPCPSVSG